MKKGNYKHKVVMIHGSSGRTKIYDSDYIVPNRRHWHGWLEDELKKLNFEVYNPIMPNDWQPNYDEWKKTIEKFLIDENTIIVATSAAGPFILKWLLENNTKVKKIILNAPTYFLGKESERIKEFCDFKLNLAVKKLAQNIIIFISNDKPLRIKSADYYKKKLDAKLIKLPDRGHFCVDDNPKNSKFPELLKEITNFDN